MKEEQAMNQSDRQMSSKTRPSERGQHPRTYSDLEKIHTEQTSEFGYSQALYDLLKDPVTLGMRGVSSNHGHQR
jgi:hypothetical protein